MASTHSSNAHSIALYANNIDQVSESLEVIWVAGIEGQSVGVGGGSDHEICQASTMGTANVRDRNDYLAVTTS